MKKIFRRAVVSLSLLSGTSVFQPAIANEHPLRIEYIAPKSPAIFPGLLLVKFDNMNYKIMDLAQIYADSKLLVDGKPVQRGTPYEGGAMSLSPGASWAGCLSFQDYTPKITPGTHEVALKFGGEESNRVNVNWSEPVSPDPLTFDQYFRGIQQTASVIKPGLPRACVEIWFPVVDGGVQSANVTRYYIGHQVKVDVPYDSQPTPETPQNAVNGPLKVYYENRIDD